MIALAILFALLLLGLIILSIPVRIRIESSMVCRIQWFFLKARIQSVGGTVLKEFRIFNRKTRLFSGKKAPKEKPVGEQKKKPKKKKRKLTKDMVMEILRDAIAKKILWVCWRFIRRSFKSVRISFLNWKIGLKDYYLQGIVFGLLHSLPLTEKFRIDGNFQEVNEFEAEITISILRLVGALLILLLSFPYLHTIFVYRRVYLKKGRA
jgi:hypothetical protein